MKNILNRKNLFTGHSLALLGIIAAILIIINLIAINHFTRLDLTTDKEFTLADATVKTVKNLSAPLYIKVYFSEKLPPDLAVISQYVKDTLAEYSSFSQKVKIEFIDPTRDSQTEQEVQAIGIPPVEMQILEKDQFKVQKGYLGIGLFYEEKKEAIPMIQNTQNLEYDLTAAIKRLTAEKIKTVGFLGGHNEHGLTQNPYSSTDQTATADYTIIKKSLDKNYQTSVVNATQPINNVDTLIVAGPKKELSDKELYEIDQFIMRGGQAIFLVDAVNIAANLQATVNPTKLEELLKNYGIQVNPDLVYDTSNENVAFSSGYMQFLLPYPLWPKLIKENFLATNPILSKLQSISFPWISSLTALKLDGVEINTLATTTKSGATLSQPFNLDPQQTFSPTSVSKVSLIVTASGTFKSAYAGKKVSEISSKEKDANSEAINSVTAGQTIDQSPASSRLIVIADSDFIADEYLSRFPDNKTFFLNAVDYLTLDSDLIAIRSKTLTNRPLKEISDSSKTWLKIINIIIIPVIVIIIGLVKFYLRKKIK